MRARYETMSNHDGEKVIAVMGSTGVGKSSFIQNSVPPRLSTKVKVGHSLRSETNKVQPVSWVNEDGTRVKLVDTPGFDDSRAGMTDAKVLIMIANFLTNEYKGKKSQLTGLIYFHRIIDTRVGGNAQRNLRMFQKLCGNDTLKNVVIVTTMWDMIDLEEGMQREEELKSSDDLFRPLLDEGAVMMRHDRTADSATAIIKYLLGKDATTPQIVHEIVGMGKALEHTAAGTELQSEMRELLDSLKAEMREMQRKLEEEMQRMGEERQRMEEERQRMDEMKAKLLMELDELKRGRSDPPPDYEATNKLPAPETKCIEDYSKLLGLVRERQSTLAPTYLDIASSVASCTIDFADAVEKSLKSIQSASSTLKPVLKSQDVHSLRRFMRMDPHPKTFTQGTWTKARHEMEMLPKTSMPSYRNMANVECSTGSGMEGVLTP
ncbi:P-loop containing nucleoside triphosphate hydrolase protein [Scleroderma citrinum]